MCRSPRSSSATSAIGPTPPRSSTAPAGGRSRSASWRRWSTRSRPRWPSAVSGRATSSGSSPPTRRSGPPSSTACCAPTPSSPARTRCTRRASWPTSSPTRGRSCSSRSSPFLDRARAALAEAGLPDDAVVTLDAVEGVTSLADLLATTATPPELTTTAGDTAVLPYSSGTTGRAKGVILTHRNLVANLCQFARWATSGPTRRSSPSCRSSTSTG